MKMDKHEIAEALDLIGTLLELKGENPFRTRAYHTAAQAIRNLTGDIETYIENDSLTSIKGIGKDLATKVTDLAIHGDTKLLAELKSSFPSGVIEMLKIPGLGPKRVKILYDVLKIASIQDLKTACENHELQSIDGFGKKTEENILKGIEQISKNVGKYLYSTANETSQVIISSLLELKEVLQCDVAGSLRRKKEIIGDIDVLVSTKSKNIDPITNAIVHHQLTERVLSKGETKVSTILKNGLQCDVRIVTPEQYPFALQYFTGSKEHNVALRTRSKKLGLSLNEYGFTPLDIKKNVTVPICKTESDIYTSLGLQYIPPELRENNGEIEAAEKGQLPQLIEAKDILGAFHCHTNYSDGVLTLEELCEAARAKHWKYIGIADHTKSAAYAGGMNLETAQKQIEHVRQLSKQYKDFKIFLGVECDILPDGSLDYPDTLLKEYDYVIASIHSKFKMSETEATERIIKALNNPYTTILGHPTGRLLLEREGYPLDLQAVIKTAAQLNKIIEINSHPKRLDLDWRWVRYAKEHGVILCISPDAHNLEGLNDVYYGIGVARKGWLEPVNVLNTWSNERIEKHFTMIRKGAQ